MNRTDVAVLGGGPAGLAAALALRQRGCRVALYDARRPPIDKACGEGLMPEAVRLLRGLGVALDERDGASFAGISFHDADSSASAAFSSGRGLAVRRTHLQKYMAARAAEMGIALHWGASVQALAGGAFDSVGTPIHAEFFVIADGLCSTLTAANGFRERNCYSTRYASRQQFRCAPWSDLVEVHWRDREQLYIAPLGDHEVGVSLLTSTRGRRLTDALPDFPAVAHRLAGKARTSSVRGAVTRTRSLREVIRGNVAVLGDASGSVDAVTGEGLLSAFRQAHALADALTAGKPEYYAVAHARMARAPGAWRSFCCCSIVTRGWSGGLLQPWRHDRRPSPRCCVCISRSRPGLALCGARLQRCGWEGATQKAAHESTRHSTKGHGCPMQPIEKEDYEDCQCRPCPTPAPVYPTRDI